MDWPYSRQILWGIFLSSELVFFCMLSITFYHIKSDKYPQYMSIIIGAIHIGHPVYYIKRRWSSSYWNWLICNVDTYTRQLIIILHILAAHIRVREKVLRTLLVWYTGHKMALLESNLKKQASLLIVSICLIF